MPSIKGRRIRDAWRSLRTRIGHRGAFLLFLALLDAISAYRLAWPDPAVLATPSYVFLADIAPLWVWAFGWAAVALICLASAFCSSDALGYGAAMVLKFAWAGVYLIGWLFFDLPQGYWSVVLWIFVALAVYDIATWPEPTYRERHSTDRPSETHDGQPDGGAGVGSE